MDGVRIPGSAGDPSISMVKKKQRKTDHTSQCRDTTSNFDTHKGQESMYLECCHGVSAFIWMVSR
jgi:hypothetical protein